MRLRDALKVKRGDVVGFTGAGGKTSALIQLGYELSSDNWRVLSTTTTKIAENELGYFPCIVKWNKALLQDPHQLAALLDDYQFVFVYKSIRNGKAMGVPTHIIRQVVDRVNSDVILIEADGSRRMPLKAPKEYEPVLPIDTTLAVPVAGLDAIGKPFTEQNVYNIETIIDRYGFGYDMPIQPAWIAQILRDEVLGLKDIPPNARVVALLNKTTTNRMSLQPARKTANMILKEKRIEAVAIGAVKNRNNPVFEVQQRIGAIVLAGGLSRRMGRSKMLLPWGKRTVIETIARRLVPFRFTDTVVVTGYKTGQVEAALEHVPIRTIFNPHFAAGEMLSSLKVGLRALGNDVDACMVILGDQPQLKTRTIHTLLQAHATSTEDIVAPMYKDKRGHPIIIGRRYWNELLDLPHGKMPRDVINNYPILTIEAEDDSILRDIDTPEQYANELKWAGLS